MTFAGTRERDVAPASATPTDQFANLSVDDIQSCLSATGVATRVARDRHDDALVAELRARYERLTMVLGSRLAA